ncbi:hypothetical protein [Miniphocaeibacter massiliensis]|uniref:hypothetical protein n=1 Tax=Miniphocaeibacter massiliensis TaxID=2041841 RepID=UPI000C1C397B|nr:hypothetical protein [Miniphocaeibacter massiliensis]
MNDKDLIYEKKLHRYGKFTSYLLSLTFILVPLGIQLIYGIKIDIMKTLGAFLAAFMVFGPTALVEFFSYPAILGAGGQYLAFTTGNMMNLKIPVSVSGMKVCHVEPGSKEAGPVSMIAVGVSSIVTTLIVFVGMLLSAQLLPVLESEFLKPALDNVMPAIMGSLAAPIFFKDWKTSSVPCILAGILTLMMGYAKFSAKQTIMLPIFLIVSVAWAYILYKRKNNNNEKTE